MENQELIPYGYCYCGCGQKTNLCTITSKKFGRIKGQPMKYINGHSNMFKHKELNYNWKGGKCIHKGYVLIRKPDHPRNVSGYVLEHILVAEKVLDKFLPDNAIVHHQDKNKSNNLNSNLVICENQEYHLLLHKRLNAYNSCGCVDWLKCKYCKQYDDPINLFVSGNQHYHRECKNKNFRENNKLKNKIKEIL